MDDVTRRTGRKRSEASRRAILDAVTELVGARGYKVLTMEAIAAQAGVGKQTIYRWWSSKAAVVLEALSERGRLIVRPKASGDLERDLGAFLDATFRQIRGARGVGPMLRCLMAEAQMDPDLARSFREQLIEERRAALATILGGALSPERIEVVIDMLFGAMWYRLLVEHAPLDTDFAHALAAEASCLAVPPRGKSPR